LRRDGLQRFQATSMSHGKCRTDCHHCGNPHAAAPIWQRDRHNSPYGTAEANTQLGRPTRISPGESNTVRDFVWLKRNAESTTYRIGVRHIVSGHLTAMSIDLSEILTTPPLEFRERRRSILGYNDFTPTQENASLRHFPATASLQVRSR